MRIDPDECRDPDLLAAEVRRLQAVIAAGAPTLTAAIPVAYAVMQPNSYSVFNSLPLAINNRGLCDSGEIVPLYRAPTLADKERAAIHAASKLLVLDGYESIADTLRFILMRLT
jgi:hypothetical protein